MKLSDLEKFDIPLFGDTAFKDDCPEEVAEMIKFFQLLRAYDPDLADIAFHVRNEGKKTRFAGFKQKQEGMLTGAADIAIMCCPPIAIEMKRKNHRLSKLSGEQLKFLVKSRRSGAFSCVALGALAAMEAVKRAREKA